MKLLTPGWQMHNRLFVMPCTAFVMAEASVFALPCIVIGVKLFYFQTVSSIPQLPFLCFSIRACVLISSINVLYPAHTLPSVFVLISLGGCPVVNARAAFNGRVSGTRGANRTLLTRLPSSAIMDATDAWGGLRPAHRLKIEGMRGTCDQGMIVGQVVPLHTTRAFCLRLWREAGGKWKSHRSHSICTEGATI